MKFISLRKTKMLLNLKRFIVISIEKFNVFLSFTFILFWVLGFAKTTKTVSVRDILRKGTELYYNDDFDSSLVLLKQAELIVQGSNSKELALRINKQIAKSYFSSQKYESAFIYFQKNIELKKELGWNDSLIGDYISISFTFLERGILDSSLIYNDTARMYQAIANDINTALENNTGRIYMDMGDFEKALRYYFAALKNAQIKTDTAYQISINLNIGTLYQRMDKYDKALEFYLRSYDLSLLSNSLE